MSQLDSLLFIAPIDLPSGVYIYPIELDNCDNQPAGNLVHVPFRFFWRPSVDDHLVGR